MINLVLSDPKQARDLPAEWADIKDQKLLVTGAAGFIGGDLFKRLHEYGLDVVGTVLYPEEAEEMNKLGYRTEILDLASDASWDDLLKGIDIVFNVAALFQEVENAESMYHKVNVDGTLKLIEAANRMGVKRFVHCSTVGVHGHVKQIPCTEQTPFNPMDEYHRTKLDGEIAVLDFAKALADDGMIVTVNRPAMVYGPGDVRMMKLFTTIAKGSFKMIGSGKVLAHLGHIADQTDSFLWGAVQPREKVHLEAFNIASDTYIPLNDVAQMIADSADVTLSKLKIPVAPIWFVGLLFEIAYRPFKAKPPIFRRRVGFFTHDRAFDLSKAKAGLNYESKVGHAEGIQETVDWYKAHGFI